MDSTSEGKTDDENHPDNEKLVNVWKKRSLAAGDVEDSELFSRVKRMRAEGVFTSLQSLTELADAELKKHFGIADFYLGEFRDALRVTEDDPFQYENELNEKLLVHGQRVYDSEFIGSYLPEASTFRSRQVNAESSTDQSRRPAQFRAFLGPSGSGKTFSAIKQKFEADLSQIDSGNHQRACTLYMTVSSFWKSPNNFVEAAEKAWLIHFKKSGQHKLKMVVHVVIDEAGFDESSEGAFKWSLPEFSELQATLQKYAETVLISVAGTNLESVLSESTDSSDPRLTKYRPTPWTLNTMLALVPNIRAAYKVAEKLTDEDARDKLKKWISDVPIFMALAGNGRAAVELVKVVFQLFDQSRDPVDNVAGVVDAVAKFYIDNNGLKSLSVEERRIVVKSVLQVLMAPDVEEPRPVNFTFADGVDSTRFAKFCHGLVDSNVDKYNTTYSYIHNGWKCPCSVSPCLAIVMFELLGFASKLSTNWESFEVICTLAQIQATVLRTATDKEFRLIKMKAPFPASNGVWKAEVPLIQEDDVVLNGPRAQHGDAFGKNTIIQSKHTVDYEEVECNLAEELYRSGLAKSDDDDSENGASVHAAITALLYRQWNGTVFGEEDSRPATTNPALPRTARTLMYPASLLETNEVVNYKLLDIIKVQAEELLEGEDKGDEGEGEKQNYKWRVGTTTITVPKQFAENVTLLICTNAGSIKLKLESEKVDERLDGDYLESQSSALSSNSLQSDARIKQFSLKPEHVDRTGALQNGDASFLETWIARNAKDGVAVRFLFCRETT